VMPEASTSAFALAKACSKESSLSRDN
jgi:hypothetical protein